ncbi:MAG: UDP-N-acetylmuramate--L-alanine ligase [Firmicutes bacterium]|nr:UDP-N-acetylmuramate--L-alanine ligase [Bacillota bacterium]
MTLTGREATGGEHVHFVGIGGAGMSAIAHVLLSKGVVVSGSDAVASEYTRKLTQAGATVYIGHDAKHVQGADRVVYSTALGSDNLELQAARANRIPLLHRSEMLALLMQEGIGIAIAGAHGKTTTTSMVAYILSRAGLDPTFLVGGVVANLQTGAHAGAGNLIVAEADESDGSFLNYRPQIAVITNIEADHLEHYGGDFARLQEAYVRFANLVPPSGLLVGCFDDVHVRTLSTAVSARVCTYSLQDAQADLVADVRELTSHGSSSLVQLRGEPLGVLTLHVPGRHNVANALAALAVALEAGVSFPVAALALEEFRGALRRFQVVYEDAERNVTVIDDYAHHPTEIEATIAALKEDGRRIVAVFQPQRYTRTFHLFEDFTKAFVQADEVIITSIYSPVGEQPIAGVTGESLCAGVREQSNAKAHFCSTLQDVQAQLQVIVEPGDVVLTMGAGDIWKAGRGFADWYRTQVG